MVSNHERDLELTILEKKWWLKALKKEYERLQDSKKKTEMRVGILHLCLEIESLESVLKDIHHEREIPS